jgi:hypothetical protein
LRACAEGLSPSSDGPDEVELFVDKDPEWRGFKEPRKGRQGKKRNRKKKRNQPNDNPVSLQIFSKPSTHQATKVHFSHSGKPMPDEKGGKNLLLQTCSCSHPNLKEITNGIDGFCHIRLGCLLRHKNAFA